MLQVPAEARWGSLRTATDVSPTIQGGRCVDAELGPTAPWRVADPYYLGATHARW